MDGGLCRLPAGVRHRRRGPGRALRQGRWRPLWTPPRRYLADAFAAAQQLQGGEQAGRQALPHELHPDLSQWVGGELARGLPHVTVDVHHPDLTVYVEIRENARLRPRPRRARRRRPAHRHGRPGGEPALRRHRLPGVLLHDGPPGRGAGDGPLRLPALHLPAGTGQGAGAGPAADGVLRPDDRSMSFPLRRSRRRSAAAARRSTSPSSCAGS